MLLLTGNEIVARACYDSGARIMFGYPITPTTEIIEHFQKHSNGQFIQTEDEIAAGFAVCGAVLAGKIAFTTSAGPGHILLQDAFSMAEAMRLPMVAVVMQRGGPSTGQVSYSQQEIILATHGGNGEGLRIVYSPSTLDELYYYTFKTFESAWRYCFPTILLGDGYLAKMKARVNFTKNVRLIKSRKILGGSKKILNLKNCFGSEEEMAENLNKNIEDFEVVRPKIEEYETINLTKAKIVIIACGSVSQAVKEALKILLNENERRIGLFRPITLSPFPGRAFHKLSNDKTEVAVIESSHGQLTQLLTKEIPELKITHQLYRPGLGIAPEEILSEVKKWL